LPLDEKYRVVLGPDHGHRDQALVPGCVVGLMVFSVVAERGAESSKRKRGEFMARLVPLVQGERKNGRNDR